MECLLDFGPIHVYWCFSFERYNGTFGKLHTNNKGIEIQFMRKIMTSKFCETLRETMKSTSLYEVLGGFFEMEKKCISRKELFGGCCSCIESCHINKFQFF